MVIVCGAFIFNGKPGKYIFNIASKTPADDLRLTLDAGNPENGIDLLQACDVSKLGGIDVSFLDHNRRFINITMNRFKNDIAHCCISNGVYNDDQMKKSATWLLEKISEEIDVK